MKLIQIRKLINKLKDEEIFCSSKDEQDILMYLETKYGYKPFSFNETDEKGIKLLEYVLELTRLMLINFNKLIPKKQKRNYIFSLLMIKQLMHLQLGLII